MKKTISLMGAMLCLGAFAFAAPPTKTAPKVTDVWTCPINLEPVANHKDKGIVYKTHRVHFCCGGCPETFAKLTDKEKDAKVAAAIKKEAASSKKPTVKG